MQFTRGSDLAPRLQAAQGDLLLPQELGKRAQFDLLILDSLSCVRRDRAETSVLFELTAERCLLRNLAVTVNTPLSQWDETVVKPAVKIAGAGRPAKRSDYARSEGPA